MDDTTGKTLDRDAVRHLGNLTHPFRQYVLVSMRAHNSLVVPSRVFIIRLCMLLQVSTARERRRERSGAIHSSVSEIFS